LINREVKWNGDIVMSNKKKVDRYGWNGNKEIEPAHTHITYWRFPHTQVVADKIEENVKKEVVPRMSKFIKTKVRKVNFMYYLESHLRLAYNETYRNRLINYIKTKENNKQNYFNTPVK